MHSLYTLHYGFDPLSRSWINTIRSGCTLAYCQTVRCGVQCRSDYFNGHIWTRDPGFDSYPSAVYARKVRPRLHGQFLFDKVGLSQKNMLM